ncbi:MAG TPA: hypothetical protein VFZ34_11170 [Blastocatellia bacterium]|nr:hypothetical protein [Blastocatellia bacterium]
MKRKVTRLTFALLLAVAHLCMFVQPTSAYVIQNVRQTFAFSLYNDCVDELIEGTAEIHQIWILNPGKVDSIHSHIKGTAVGRTSGNKYIVNETYKDDFSNFACGATLYGHIRQRLISLGKAPNVHVDFLVTYATDADCNPLPTIYTPETTHCQ